jgi:hypothetical protein
MINMIVQNNGRSIETEALKQSEEAAKPRENGHGAWNRTKNLRLNCSRRRSAGIKSKCDSKTP